MIDIDVESLKNAIKELNDDIEKDFVESSVFIGWINGNPIEITVYHKDEVNFDSDSIDDKYDCIKDSSDAEGYFE